MNLSGGQTTDPAWVLLITGLGCFRSLRDSKEKGGKLHSIFGISIVNGIVVTKKK